MLALILREAGLRSVVHRRRRRERDRHRRGVDRRRVVRRRSRRERRHASSSSPLEAAIVTNVEADHLEHYGELRRARRGRSDEFLSRRTVRSSCAPTTPSRPGSAGAGRRDARTARADDADYRIVDARAERRRTALHVARTAVELARARSAFPCRALHMRRERVRGAIADGSRARCAVRRRAHARSRDSAAWRAGSSSAASAAASPSSTTTRTCPARSPRCSTRPARAATTGAASSPCSSRTATGVRRSCRTSTAMRSSMPTSWC